jgi:hypothetical protein
MLDCSKNIHYDPYSYSAKIESATIIMSRVLLMAKYFATTLAPGI